MTSNVRGEPWLTGWLTVLERLVYSPEYLVCPRGLRCAEMSGLSIYISDLRQNILVHPARHLNYRFMVAEWLWIALGRDDLEPLARYNSVMRNFSDDGQALAGAYGPRLFPQWPWVHQLLEDDPDTRQAVVSIWTPRPTVSKDIPCTIALQFLQRDGRLNCIAAMRSSDAWLGLPYDVFCFSQLTNCLAGELGVEPGWLQLNLGSSHLYEEHWEKAAAVLQHADEGELLTSPSLPCHPPAWLHLPLDGHGMLEPKAATPWLPYAKVLYSQNSADALEILRATQP